MVVAAEEFDSASPGDRPIADLAMVGDGHTAALIASDGSIEWWCPGRFDQPAAFGRLLDPEGGHWSLHPVQPFTTSRRYIADTMVLETTFTTPSGQILVLDGLALGEDERDHEIGRRSPSVLFRVLVADAPIEMTMTLSLRPDFGRATPRLARDERGWTVTGDANTFHLEGSARVKVEQRGSDLLAHWTAEPGRRDALTLQVSHDGSPRRLRRAEAVLLDTVVGWRSWARLHPYEGWEEDLVRSSARVLQSLTYAPTGALVAAPTTSLPEIVGGASNWDYRFAWLRDHGFYVRALSTGACLDEAERYVTWMAQVCRPKGDERPPVVVGLGGERHLVERGVPHWRGWRASSPVRVGNAAWEQFQLDITGEVWTAVELLMQRDAIFQPEEVSFFVGLADLAATRWQDPDSGIWEGREGQRHYTTSKVMCWAALDRACRLAAQLGVSDRVAGWKRARNEIHRRVMAEAWDDRRKTFTGAFGSDHLDASTLLIPLVGFLPAHHPRVRKTVDAIERSLSDQGLVRRWTDAEDEPFVMCSFWLAECHAMAGNLDRAIEVFHQVAGHANDVGLLAEEVAASSGALIGNFPQGLSHAALVNAADTIDRSLTTRRRRR